MRRNAIAWVAIAMSTAALIGSQNWTRTLPAAQEIPAEGQKQAKALSDAFQAVAEFVKPSVVQISTERSAGSMNLRRGRPAPDGPGEMDPEDFEELLKRFRRFFPDGFDFEPQQFTLQGIGSGFVYDDKGHILTNNHVVEGSKKITVTFHDGETASAKVVGTDPETDVAVIKVDRTDYRPVLKGPSDDLKVGEWVLAVGSPFGLSQTVTAGIISATHRDDVRIIDDGYEDFIQTDAAINRGNSGGPLVDMNGRVVGINAAIATSTTANAGVGFAIPIDMAAELADRLIKDGKVQRARLGILLQPLTPALAGSMGLDPKTKGILVGQVVPGSPAEKAGLRTGDIVTGFDNEPVVSVPTFRMTVATSEIGKSFQLTYLREGKEQTATVVLAPAEQVEVPALARNRREPEPEAEPEAPKVVLDDFGLGVQALTPELAQQFGHAKDVEGVLVKSVAEGSPAAGAGLEPGYLITQVVKDRKVQPVPGLDEFQALIDGSEELAVYVQTPDGVGRFVTLSKVQKD